MNEGCDNSLIFADKISGALIFNIFFLLAQFERWFIQELLAELDLKQHAPAVGNVFVKRLKTLT